MSWTNTIGVFLDSAIKVLSPTLALERMGARLSAEQLSGMFNRGARYSRTDGRTTTGRGASGDVINERGLDRREFVDRARQLERDSVIAETLLSRSTEAVVGDGYRPQAKTADPKWNEKAEALWKEWAGTTACDVRGMSKFPELLGLGFRSCLRDGDVGAVKLAAVPGDRLGGRLRMFESDELADPRGFAANRVDGVDLDEAGKPVGFWLLQSLNTGWADRRAIPNHVRVPADYVLFLARRLRLGHTRGLSALATIAWLIDQIDGNVEAITTSARMAACFGLILKRKRGMPGLPTTTGADGIARRKMRVEPGAFIEVDIDEDVTQLDPKQPTQDFPQFIRMLARLVALAFGLPLEVAFLDFSQTTYASSRGALLQAWKTWRGHQERMKTFCTSIYQWKIVEWIEAGLLPYRADALEHAWLCPGWQWLDPEAEIKAAMAAIDAGLETHSAVAARMGLDLEELLVQATKDRAALRAAGVPEVRSTLTRDPAQPPGQGEEKRKAA
jgi:lambda family phage portal protein